MPLFRCFLLLILSVVGIYVAVLICFKENLVERSIQHSGHREPFSKQIRSETVQIRSETVNYVKDGYLKLKQNDKYNWSHTSRLHKSNWQFAPALNSTEYAWYMDLITTFKRTVDAFNISYMLYEGSALGAYRYHGFVPWDDDFDCLVDVSQKHILKNVLKDISGHTLLSPNDSLWKFYDNRFPNAGSYKWSWPFVDIFFFQCNDKHLYDVTHKKPRWFVPKSYMLPPGKGIFENLVFPVPNRMESYLRISYKLGDNVQESCSSNRWNHKTETKMKSTTVPCSKFFGVYPHVRSYTFGNVSFEDLRLGQKVLYRIQRPTMNLITP